MTKFQQKSFSEYYGGKKYSEGWDRIFGKQEKVKEDSGHYKECNINFDGPCDCALIKDSDSDAEKKCSNCSISTDKSPYPDKLICALVGSSCPKDYYCSNYKEEKI